MPASWQDDFVQMVDALTKQDPLLTTVACNDTRGATLPLPLEQRHRAWQLQFGRSSVGQVEELAAGLQASTWVTNVDVSYCKLGGDGTAVLMNSMNSSILQLHVAGNFLRAPVVSLSLTDSSS